MKSIILSNIDKSLGSKLIFSRAALQINPGEKYGLIGPNGCGKTTLLNILSGQDSDYSGDVQGTTDIRIGYLRQHMHYPESLTVQEAILKDYEKIISDLRAAEELLAHADPHNMENALVTYQKARDTYDIQGVDHVVSRVKGMLAALGIPVKMKQRIKTLSGGEKKLLALACELIKKPDLLLLDEPDNHLDFKGLSWFENLLKNSKKTVIIVSHNRYLLDRVCSLILEIEKQKVYTFKGNYSAYRMEKLKKQTSQQADYAAVSRRLARLQKLVNRFREIAGRTADPAWGKRLRARKTQLQRESKQAVDNPLTHSKSIRIDLNTQNSKAAIALRLNDYSRSIGELRLFEDVHLEILCGEKVGLVGANGCGKTTLLKDIILYGEWGNQKIRIGPSLKVGYMAQQQEVFGPQNTIEAEMRALGPLSREDVFKLVSKFLFSWQDMDKKIKTLSGGEINRLQLARLIYLQPTFLILDEPTNHLDIPSREVVEEAVADFKGTVLAVSHDRYFLEKIADRIVEVKDMGLTSHRGGFSEFWFKNYSVLQSDRGKVKAGGARRKRHAVTQGAGSRKTHNRLAELEDQIARAEKEKMALEKQITDAFRHGEHQLGRKLSVKLERLIATIDKLYTEWEGLE
ncbi:MAG: ABC-F family ATP-binding cassette domain-containing protein [Spirochaetales bacterium]|nr:ABC-F family ATP-binding cassette domain-containing protein [Spirochaetales bacterium]